MKRSHWIPAPMLAWVMAAALAACGDSVVAPDSTHELTKQERLQEAMELFDETYPHILGVIVHAEIGDQGPWVAAAGYRDRSRTQPIRPTDQFGIGSITKMYTATVVLRLWEAGQVDLDAPVIGYLSEEWADFLGSIPYGDVMTVRQVLSHTSGLREFGSTSDHWPAMLGDPGKAVAPLEVVSVIQNEAPTFPPGQGSSYSNTNYMVLGNLIEAVTGQPYESMIQQHLLDPLATPHTTFYPEAPGSSFSNMAHGYAPIGSVVYDNLDFNLSHWAWSAGGLYGTAAELARFQKALASGAFHEDPATLAAMLDFGENPFYALGVQGMAVSDTYPTVGRCFGHGGYAFGSSAQVRHCPDLDLTLALFFSSDGTTVEVDPDILWRIYEAIL